MRTQVGIVGALLSACYAPSVPQEVPCSEGMECPGSQVCDRDGLCRDEPLPDAPPPDTDGDSVIDADDNCVMLPNSMQYDEDSDGVGNECDNCPAVPNTDQASTTDVDDAGDACDVSADVRETFELFEGFDDRPMDWSLDMGWKAMGGRLVRDASGTAGFAIPDRTFGPDTIVVTAGELVPGSGTTGTPNMAIVMRHASATEFYRCSVTATRGELARHAGTGFTTLGTMDIPGPKLDSVGIVLFVSGGNVNCITAAGAMAYSVVATDPMPLTGTKAGLRAREATAHFDYFFAYRIEPFMP